MAGRTATPAIDIVCEDCGSTDVTRDARAAWDVRTQTWVLAAVNDHAHCHQCDKDARLAEVPLKPARP